jgi:hypothetical protein
VLEFFSGILKVFSSIFLFAEFYSFVFLCANFFVLTHLMEKIDEHGALLAGNVKQLPEIRLNEDLPLKI